MTDWMKSIATGAAGVIIGSLVVQIIPEINTTSDVVNAVNNPLVQFILITIIIYAAITKGLRWLADLLSKDEGRGFYTPYGGSRPDTGTIVGELRHEGVNWPFIWGETRGRYHSWVDRPNCPRCGNGLNSETNHRRIRADKPIWECPACGFSTERRDVTDQRRSVQKIVEQEGDRIIRGLMIIQKDEVESMLEDIKERATDEEPGATLSFQQTNHEMSDAEREAIENAVDEVVDEDDLQNRDKVLMLDHLLELDVGPRNQYDVLWWETDERAVRTAISRRT